MRSSNKIVFALLTALFAIGISAPAQASPVVDQYTEEIPTPGGSEPIEPGMPGVGNGPAGKGEGVSYVIVDGKAVLVDENGNPVADGGIPVSAISGGAPNAGSSVVNGMTTGGESTGAIASSGGDTDGGMGWLFPAALILSAGLITGIAIGRRNKGNLAT